LKKILKILDGFVSSTDNIIEEDILSFDEMTLATCVLLIEVSLSDDSYDDEEKNKIIGILKNKFNLDDSQINILMELADKKNKEMISLYDWTSKINEIYSYEQKKELIKLLWDVAFADGRIDKYEDYTIRKIADLIYVRHEDFMKAKHR
jgi:uncharacterized tellurite resistance protein B-like protein|tara:strand:- start:182 stop:628 length:447 start_codon:yes stop_codon:yes gene_type:complete